MPTPAEQKEINARIRREATEEKQRQKAMQAAEDASREARGSTYNYDINSGQTSPVEKQKPEYEGGYSGQAAAKRKKYIESQTE